MFNFLKIVKFLEKYGATVEVLSKSSNSIYLEWFGRKVRVSDHAASSDMEALNFYTFDNSSEIGVNLPTGSFLYSWAEVRSFIKIMSKYYSAYDAQQERIDARARLKKQNRIVA